MIVEFSYVLFKVKRVTKEFGELSNGKFSTYVKFSLIFRNFGLLFCCLKFPCLRVETLPKLVVRSHVLAV